MTDVGPAPTKEDIKLAEEDASKYVNDQQIEMQWAVKAYQHAEVYFNVKIF